MITLSSLSSFRVIVVAGLVILPAFLPTASGALVDLTRPGGGVVFTFSHGYTTALAAAAILANHGYAGTFYVGSGTLREGPYYTAFVSVGDVVNLSLGGHEIASMGVTQSDLTTLTPAQVASELASSRSTLEAITGKTVTQFAYPFAGVNASVAAAVAAEYESGRKLTQNVNDFAGAIDAYELPGLMMTQSVTLAMARAHVDFAIANGIYIVLAFDDIVATPDANDWSPADLDALAAYIGSRNATVATMSQLISGIPPPVAAKPGAPVLAATHANAQVSLTWAAPPPNGAPVTSYQIWRSTTSGNEAHYRTIDASLNFTDTNVTNGNAYYYQISANNSFGSSNRSNEVNATPSSYNVPPNARLVFTFVNGYASAMTAAPSLEAYGFHGTFYASSALLRQGALWTAYVSAADLTSLSGRGHDIGSMTVSQPDLTTLSPAALTSQLVDSQASLQAIVGKPVRMLAYPYGSFNANVTNAASIVYDAGQLFTNTIADFAQAPADNYHTPSLLVTRSTTLATAKGYVDYAIANNVPVVLAFGAIVTTPGAYDWTPTDLSALAAYTAQKGIPVVTLSQLVAGAPPARPEVPSAPTLRVIPGNALVNVSWTIPDNGGVPISGYKLWKSSNSSNETLYRTLGVTTTFRDANVTNEATYYYEVTAVNAIGEGPRSNEAAAKPTRTGVPPGAAIVFTFDDGLRSQLTAVGPLKDAGFKATFYVNPGVFRSGKNNPDMMSSKEVADLAKAGHDIESHLVTHVDCTTLSASAMDAALKNAQMTLRNVAQQPVNYLAWPFGAHNAACDAAAAKYYRSARAYNSDFSVATAHATAMFAVPAMGIMTNDTAAKVKAYVDYAITNNVTVVLVIHNLAPVPSSYGLVLDAYDWNLATLKQVIDYVALKKVPVRTIAELGDAGRMPPN